MNLRMRVWVKIRHRYATHRPTAVFRRFGGTQRESLYACELKNEAPQFDLSTECSIL